MDGWYGSDVVFGTLASQGVGALVLAILIRSFYRQYGKAYLSHWAQSWVALVAFVVSSGIVRHIALRGVTGEAVSAIAVAIKGGAWYLHVGLLILAFWELTTERPARQLFIRYYVGSLFIAGAAAPLAARILLGGTGEWIADGVRTLAAGIVLTGLAIWMYRRFRAEHGVGIRLASMSLLFYGIHQLHYFALHLVETQTGALPGYGHWLAYGDFLLQALVGLGMVSSLLEEERQSAFLASQQIEHVAYHDPLTGLPNRSLFLDRLIVALAHAARHEHKVAVFFLDVDHFKDINDTLGHSHGDALLKDLAERIRRCIRGGDTVSRFGGDEFTLLVQNLDRVEDVARVAQKLLYAVKRPFTIADQELFVSVSVGISLYPLDGTDPETLLKNADTAMYRAKEQGRDNYQIYAPAMNACAVERLSLESDLRRALDSDDLEVYYQPLVELGTGAVYGAEALLRWRRPDGRLSGPRNFIRALEASGLIVPVGEWVLRSACREAVEWSERHGANIGLSVNLSARQFLRPDLAERVAMILMETGLEASRLELEITETCAMQNAENSVRALRELKQIGVRIAVDDFGTGYSSLNYLKRFPLDSLKLDKSFVRDVTEDPGDAAIAAAVISIAETLGLTLIAEGIETEEQLAFFRTRGCPRGQGFLFGRPMAAGDFHDFLRKATVHQWPQPAHLSAL